MELFGFALLLMFIPNGFFVHGVLSVRVQDYGYNDIPIFGTALKFSLQLVNEEDIAYKATVTADECCVEIDVNDTDCDSMTLGRPVSLYLAKQSHKNSTADATFYFRNLYVRFRIGSCRFIINSEPSNISLPSSDVIAMSSEFHHPITFDTTPDNVTFNCSGVDQDPDRNCTPVDCAIKYRGKRNFYRNTTGKCEPVVDCNTRGDDGITITGYFDWDRNLCIRYDWFTDDNYFEFVESDTEIPAEIDPSQNKYYPNLEPKRLMQSVNQSNYTIKCNRGKQKGIYCVCNNGWKSSGIHHDNPTVFVWCDISIADPADITSSKAPRKLGRAMEVISCIEYCIHYTSGFSCRSLCEILTIANITLLICTIYLLTKLLCSTWCVSVVH